MRRIVLRRPPMPPLPRIQDHAVFSAAGSVWALLVGMGLLLLGNGLQGSLLGVRAAEESFGSTVTGIVVSGYFIGFLIGSQIAPRTIRRVGHLRVFAAVAALASIAILLQSLIVTPTVWALMRVLTGYCLASAYIVTESWLNDRVTNEHRGGLLSVYMIVSYFGMGGGQLLLNTGDPAAHELFILVSVLISFAAIPILFSLTPQPVQEAPERLGARALYRISPLGIFGSFSTGILQGAVFGMGAVYGRIAGLSVGQISIFMFILIAAPALAQWPIGKFSDRIDRRKVITGLAVFGFGATLGPSTAGLLMDAFGPSGFLFLLGGAQAGIVAFALHRMRITRTGPLEAQSPWSMNPARTAALSPALAEVAAEAADEAAAEETSRASTGEPRAVDDTSAGDDAGPEDQPDGPTR